MKNTMLRASIFALIFSGILFADNTNAIRREIANIEEAADKLMEQILDVPSRNLRRKMAAQVDDLYEAAERMRLLVTDADTIPKPIRAEDLQMFIETLKGVSFSDNKVDMIGEFAKTNWFTVKQVGLMIEEVSFGDDKVDAILACYPHITDPHNSYLLYEYVTFSDDRDRLKQGIAELESE